MKLEYKPSSGMVWRVSPAQGKTLYRETEGTAGKAAFPEETREVCNTMHKTCLQSPRNTTISSVVAEIISPMKKLQMLLQKVYMFLLVYVLNNIFP